MVVILEGTAREIDKVGPISIFIYFNEPNSVTPGSTSSHNGNVAVHKKLYMWRVRMVRVILIFSQLFIHTKHIPIPDLEESGLGKKGNVLLVEYLECKYVLCISINKIYDFRVTHLDTELWSHQFLNF